VAVLNIRNLPAEVHARLRVRAARGGRSMEAEARAILAAVCRMDFLWNWRVLLHVPADQHVQPPASAAG